MKKYFIILFLITSTIIAIYYIDLNHNAPIPIVYSNDAPTKIKPKINNSNSTTSPKNTIYSTLVPNDLPQKNNRSQTLRLAGPEQPIILNKNEEIEDIFNNIVPQHKTLNPSPAAQQPRNAHKNEQSTLENLEINNNDKPKKHSYQIQLACVRSEESGIIMWDQIRQKHSKILQNVKANFQKVQQTENKFYFLLLAGSYTSKNQAHAICKRLITQGQYCIVNPK